MCKYIFKEEEVDWSFHNIKCRKPKIIAAIFISIYLGNWFYSGINMKELADIFGRSRSDAHHGIKSIRNLSITDRKLRERLDKYTIYINRKFNLEEQINSIASLPIETVRDRLLTSIDSMVSIVRIYCELTGTELVKKPDRINQRFKL